MVPNSRVKSIFAARHWHVLVAILLFATCTPTVFAQDEKGCQAVEYAKRPYSQYSTDALQKRLERNSADVDALVNLGIRLEEQGQLAQAEALYEKAIQTKPDCSLGYLFAGLVRDRISRKASSEAEANIRKALSLNPSLQNDGNVQGFMKSHLHLMGSVHPVETETRSDARQMLATANRFSIGVAVGILLTTVVLCLVRFRRTAPTGT